jgi:hypothetical protein
MLRIVVGLGLLLALLQVDALAQSGPAVVEDFSEEQVGAAPNSFSTPIGWWSIGTDGTSAAHLLFEDGTRYSAATGQSDLAAQAQAQAQGVSVRQVADNSPGLDYYPLALFNRVVDFSSGSIVTRFAILGGDLDNEAGIVFDYQPNGDYLALRVDADARALKLSSIVQGQASALSIVDNVPAELARWHELRLVVAPGGTHLSALLDEQLFMELDINVPVSGRVGAMAKTDSVVVYNTFSVDPDGR